MVVWLHTEVEAMEVHMGLVAGHMELVGRKELLVDMEQGSATENVLRNFAEEDRHLVAVRSSAEEDIVPGLEQDIVVADRKELADHKELVGRREVVGGVPGLGFRNSCCSTWCLRMHLQM
jgi:hypothetical protein